MGKWVCTEHIGPEHFISVCSNTPHLSSTPPVFFIWEVIRCSATNRIHRNLTSAGYSASRAFLLRKYHCPLRFSSPSAGVTPLHSRYRVDRSLPREITAHLLSLACPLIAYNAGNVPDEWVFSCQSSQGGYLPLQVVASENDCFLRLSRKFFQIFFDSPHSLCDG